MKDLSRWAVCTDIFALFVQRSLSENTRLRNVSERKNSGGVARTCSASDSFWLDYSPCLCRCLRRTARLCKNTTLRRAWETRGAHIRETLPMGRATLSSGRLSRGGAGGGHGARGALSARQPLGVVGFGSVRGGRPDAEAESLFVRRPVALQAPEGQTAWVYWYNGAVGDRPRVASADWAAHISDSS